LARSLAVQEINTLELIIFCILSIFMLGGSITMITSKQTIFSAFGFLITMLGLAGMFALLDSRFLAIAQIMVSVGAIVVLSMLTILTINSKDENLPKEEHKYKLILLSLIITLPFAILLYKTLSTLPHYFATTKAINAKIVGELLFSKWILPFEIISILLLVAMLGAIVIARGKIFKKEVHK